MNDDPSDELIGHSQALQLNCQMLTRALQLIEGGDTGHSLHDRALALVATMRADLATIGKGIRQGAPRNPRRGS
jgi:hypothetical protein